MPRSLFRCLFAFCFLAAVRLHGQVIVNEIMYRPGTGFPENTGLEFIELHNPTAAPVDVSGWAVRSTESGLPLLLQSPREPPGGTTE